VDGTEFDCCEIWDELCCRPGRVGRGCESSGFFDGIVAAVLRDVMGERPPLPLYCLIVFPYPRSGRLSGDLDGRGLFLCGEVDLEDGVTLFCCTGSTFARKGEGRPAL
jgi:hypothetical protein